MQSASSKASWNGPWPERLRRALQEYGEPASPELPAVLEELLGRADRIIDLVRLKARVYRMYINDGRSSRSLILKRLKPPAARAARLVVKRWLPAIGLGDRCPRLYGEAADGDGSGTWHLYEDLGEDTIARDPKPDRVAAVVVLMAELHARAAGHIVLREARGHGHDYGTPYLTSNVFDAIRELEALSAAPLPPASAGVRLRLLDRLRRLRDDLPRRVSCLGEAGGPETLLHGDFWTTNAFVISTPHGLRGRLIDWDRVGVGPIHYDLSAFLYRFPRAERRWILGLYRLAVQLAGWRLPGVPELNLLFDSAEQGRYANCVAWTAAAWLQDGAGWAPQQLVEIERWFRALQPALPE